MNGATHVCGGISAGLMLWLAVAGFAVAAQAQIGGIERALKCGTIGGVGLDRCRDQEAPQPSCDDGGSADDLAGVEQAIAEGMRAAGLTPRADSVFVFRKQGGLICFQVRLDADGEPLPSLSCILEHLEGGEVEPGSITGSKTVIVGCIQQAGGRTRVTAREIELETGVVGDTGKGDAAGTDADAIREAAGAAFDVFAGPEDTG